MDAFQLTLVAATLLCSLVAGFVFAFTVVIMPGIATLEDGEFLRAFQAMDRVIQKGQPIFMLVWLGSAVALIAATAMGFGRLEGMDRILLVAATAVFILGVHVPTAVINIPLNNKIQTLTIEDMDDSARTQARRDFEARWNLSNTARTILAVAGSALLMVLLLRL